MRKETLISPLSLVGKGAGGLGLTFMAQLKIVINKLNICNKCLSIWRKVVAFLNTEKSLIRGFLRS